MKKNNSNLEIDIFKFLGLIYEKKYIIVLILLFPILLSTYIIYTAEERVSISLELVPLSSERSDFEKYNNEVLLFNKFVSSYFEERELKILEPKNLFDIYLFALKDLDKISFEDIIKNNFSIKSISNNSFQYNNFLYNSRIKYPKQKTDLVIFTTQGIKDREKWIEFFIKINENGETFVRKRILDSFNTSRSFFESHANSSIQKLNDRVKANKIKLESITLENPKEKTAPDAYKTQVLFHIAYDNYLNQKILIQDKILEQQNTIKSINDSKKKLEKLYTELTSSPLFDKNFKVISFKNFKIVKESNLIYKPIVIISLISIIIIILYISSLYAKRYE